MGTELPKPVANWLRGFLTHLFTGADNATFDVARVLWFCSVLYAMGLEGADVILNHVALNLQNFGTGMAVLLAGGGVGVAIKAGAEPAAKK